MFLLFIISIFEKLGTKFRLHMVPLIREYLLDYEINLDVHFSFLEFNIR